MNLFVKFSLIGIKEQYSEKFFLKKLLVNKLGLNPSFKNFAEFFNTNFGLNFGTSKILKFDPLCLCACRVYLPSTNK